MSDTAEQAQLRSSVFFHGVIAGAAIVVSLFVAGYLAWQWLDSAWPGREITDSQVRLRTLNEYLETRSISAGTFASVALESDCDRWVATVELYRPDDPTLVVPDGRPELADTATFVVQEDSGDPIPVERPGMSAAQVKAELHEEFAECFG
jgi:hypothetical protein